MAVTGDAPTAIPVSVDGIPDVLKERDRWLVWQYEWKADRQEYAKVPKDGAGGGFRIDATDPDNGATFDAACETYEKGDYSGLGLIQDPEDPFVGLDWDDCRDPDQGLESVPDAVRENVADVDSYTEVSPSGTGYRQYAIGEKPDGRYRGDLLCDDVLDDTPHVEMYDGTSGRYLTVTGQRIDGTPADVREADEALATIHEEYIAAEDVNTERGEEPAPQQVQTASGPTASADSISSGPGNCLSDEAVISSAKDAKNGEKFSQLWNGDTSGYRSHSEADLALCGILAFWTAKDAEQMDRLYRQSGLYRSKWDEVHYENGRTYGQGTMDTAIEGCSDVYLTESDSTVVPSGGPAAAAADGGEKIVSVPLLEHAHAVLEEHGPLCTSDVADRVDYHRKSVRQVRRAMKMLESWGRVVYERDGRSGHWKIVD